ncbi:MAG TPA: arginine--tRNA ligase, partial [Pseudogracilibacillus sp.]|nr:arginine--tRNA ligase [Pseudogracilibacillus sp.]
MTLLSSIEETLKSEIKQAIIQAELCTEDELPDIILEEPREKAHGDFATNIAMQLARVARQAPRQIAEQIVDQLDQSKAQVERVEIAGPGFINFFMDESYLHDVVNVILEAKDNYGRSDVGSGKRIQVEFVSL